MKQHEVALVLDVSGSMEYLPGGPALKVLSALLQGSPVPVVLFTCEKEHQVTLLSTPEEVMDAIRKNPFSGGGSGLDSMVSAMRTAEGVADHVVIVTDGMVG